MNRGAFNTIQNGSTIQLINSLLNEIDRKIHHDMQQLLREVKIAMQMYANRISKTIADSHNLTVLGIDHMCSVVETKLTDAKYLDSTVDAYSYLDFSECSYSYSIEEYLPRVVELSNHSIDNKKWPGRLEYSQVDHLIIHCNNVACNMTKLIKAKMTGGTPYLFVLACMFHHYEIENIPFVSVILTVKTKTMDGNMFIYLLESLL